ncbi:MAG: DNA translocase FtsK, partial [Gemmatimonadaceae bacterium]
RVGYGRAARIVDQLEEAGILAPSKGPSRPRDVLVGSAELDRICASS